MMRVLLVAEIDCRPEDVQERLDGFREAVLPEMNYGITLFRATPGDYLSFEAVEGGFVKPLVVDTE